MHYETFGDAEAMELGGGRIRRGRTPWRTISWMSGGLRAGFYRFGIHSLTYRFMACIYRSIL